MTLTSQSGVSVCSAHIEGFLKLRVRKMSELPQAARKGKARGRGRRLLDAVQQTEVKPGLAGHGTQFVVDTWNPEVGRKAMQDSQTNGQNHDSEGAIKITEVQREASGGRDPAIRPLESTNKSVKQLTQYIESLSLAQQDDLERIYKLASSSATEESNLEEIVNTIYARSLEDWRFSPSGAAICNSLAGLEAGKVKFRSCLLGTIQRDFKNKDDIRKQSLSKYLGCVSFLCQVFSTLRDAKGEPFKPLVGPVCQCIEALTGNDATDREIECGVWQLHSVGYLIQQLDTTGKITQIMNNVRTRIIDARPSEIRRSALMEILELSLSGWSNLPTEARDFYSCRNVNCRPETVSNWRPNSKPETLSNFKPDGKPDSVSKVTFNSKPDTVSSNQKSNHKPDTVSKWNPVSVDDDAEESWD